MKGLVLNNFYSMEGTIKISFFISMFLAFFSIVLSNPKLISMVIALQIFIVMTNVGTSLHVDESSKWNKMEITLPVKRKSIVTAKYISFIILIFIGLLFTLLTLLIQSFIGAKINSYILLEGYSYGLSLSISTVALLYPIILKFGANKNETMLMVAVGIDITIRFLVWGILNLFIGNFTLNFNGIEVGVYTTVFSILLFIASYIISIYIHKRKSF